MNKLLNLTSIALSSIALLGCDAETSKDRTQSTLDNIDSNVVELHKKISDLELEIRNIASDTETIKRHLNAY